MIIAKMTDLENCGSCELIAGIVITHIDEFLPKQRCKNNYGDTDTVPSNVVTYFSVGQVNVERWAR